MKCKRCNVALEPLNVVNFNKELEDMNEWFWIMLYGGEVRRYLAYECPTCGELSLFRVLCDHCKGTGIVGSKHVPVHDREDGVSDFLEEPIFCGYCKGTGKKIWR